MHKGLESRKNEQFRKYGSEVAIARALAMHSEILLFDEPTSVLDPTMVSEVLEVIA